jgi:hypothetical protein
MVIDSERGNTNPYDEVHVGVHFYKYEKQFNFNLKPSDRPLPISNVYIPSRPDTNININRLVGYSLKSLDSIENGANITAVSEEELNQALKEVESKV